LTPTGIDAGVDHDAVKPGIKRRLSFKPLDVAKRLQKSVLGAIPGFFGVTVQHLVGYGVYFLLVPQHQLFNGPGVIVFRPAHEFFVSIYRIWRSWHVRCIVMGVFGLLRQV
jgi:hypothetical protein